MSEVFLFIYHFPLIFVCLGINISFNYEKNIEIMPIWFEASMILLLHLISLSFCRDTIITTFEKIRMFFLLLTTYVFFILFLVDLSCINSYTHYAVNMYVISSLVTLVINNKVNQEVNLSKKLKLLLIILGITWFYLANLLSLISVNLQNNYINILIAILTIEIIIIQNIVIQNITLELAQNKLIFINIYNLALFINFPILFLL